MAEASTELNVSEMRYSKRGLQRFCLKMKVMVEDDERRMSLTMLKKLEFEVVCIETSGT